MNEFEQLLLEKLKCIEVELNTLREDVVNVRVAVAKLTVKSGIWGAMAGLIPVLMFMVWKFVS